MRVDKWSRKETSNAAPDGLAPLRRLTGDVGSRNVGPENAIDTTRRHRHLSMEIIRTVTRCAPRVYDTERRCHGAIRTCARRTCRPRSTSSILAEAPHLHLADPWQYAFLEHASPPHAFTMCLFVTTTAWLAEMAAVCHTELQESLSELLYSPTCIFMH